MTSIRWSLFLRNLSPIRDTSSKIRSMKKDELHNQNVNKNWHQKVQKPNFIMSSFGPSGVPSVKDNAMEHQQLVERIISCFLVC
mmetsp:Transcript_5347/g.7342  ORF Transcript_5347/g.7342 Transcript_5347/m.7342 type:complete len:84 (+) Transcript_5347:38-289(+)